jgi:hypothetical protein
MKFTKRGDKYRALNGNNEITIEPNQGGWMLKENGRDVEWFLESELAAAKKWAKGRAQK